jgi:hypothetical protein
MKANQTQTIETTEIKSIKDAAYRFARTSETSSDIARYIVNRDPSFPNELSAELKADLNAGFMLRAHELWGQDVYKVGDQGTLIKIANSRDADYQEKIKGFKGLRQYNVNVAYSMSAQEFGQLKNKDPQEHSVLKAWRDRFSKYSSNNIAALKLAARALLNDGKTRERSATKNFTDALGDAFDTFEKRVKNAEARGDQSASPVKFKVAVDAFWKAYNA